jgi:toxin YoeB
VRQIHFTVIGFEQYNEWSVVDRRTFIRLGKLIRECTRTPFTGTGKPEALKYDFKGYWSRRITLEHRLVYKVADESILVVFCMNHYE